MLLSLGWLSFFLCFACYRYAKTQKKRHQPISVIIVVLIITKATYIMAKTDYTTGKGYSTEGLLNLCSNIIAEARTDIDELSPYGINEVLLQMAEAKALELNSLPTSEQDRYNKVDATKAKNDKLDEVKNKVYMMKKQTRMFLYLNPNKENAIYLKSLNGLKEDFLMNHLDNYSKILEKDKEFLVEYGITDEIIYELKQDIKEIDKLINIQLVLIDTVKNTSYARSVLKKEIYSMLSHISAIAKHYWKNIDPRKYKKYLIAPRPKVGRKKGSRG